MILESRPAEAHESMGTQYSEDSAVFYLEMLFRIVVQNRDRILTFWNSGIVLEKRDITRLVTCAYKAKVSNVVIERIQS